MLNDFYKQFKSGTDIRGVASEGVEGQSVNLTDEAVADMADGFVLWLSKKVNKPCDRLTISVGRDSRISGPHIMEITTKRFKASGAKVLCCG
ncbi:MAG: phosphomannomutase/phosphoglucomutase, partial [Ruminococcus sp.]|nr:phosphomannomutase/phosphoglucomutase [Ruminococcus sp.]